jgi:signal transduction histidine kinase
MSAFRGLSRVPGLPDVMGMRARWSYRGSVWVAGAAALAVLGCLGSLFGARATARQHDQKAQRVFAAASDDVGTDLELAFQHEQDLAVSAGAFLSTSHGVTNTRFAEWMQADRVTERYPEILGMARIVLVPASRLAGYAARAESTRPGPRSRDGSFQVTPPGRRPYYCFVDLRSDSPMLNGVPAGLDACATQAGVSLLAARDAGARTSELFRLGNFTVLGLPVYRGGVVPKTLSARRAKFLSWIEVGLDPSFLLRRSSKEHPTIAVTARYSGGSTPVVFTSGQVTQGAETLVADRHDGWVVETRTELPGRGVLHNHTALAQAIVGIALSVLVGLLGGVLATGRARALRLVRRQTGELHEQAGALRDSVQELEAANAQLEEIQRERTRLLARTVEVAEQERMRVAMELHDGPIQKLTVVAFNLDRLSNWIARGHEGAGALAQQTRDDLAIQMLALRRVMSGLRPPVLDERSLAAALNDCADEVFAHAAIVHETTCDIGSDSLAPEIETAVYRVVREALINVRRHANASRVDVAVERHGESLQLLVTDDGSGFEHSAAASEHGLLAMKERIGSIGGRLEVASRVGSGTRVEATLPWKARLLPIG